MAKPSLIYKAYLLRLWRSDGQSAWRASLEDPQSGVRLGFATLPDLIAFLNGPGDEPPPALPGNAEPTNEPTGPESG